MKETAMSESGDMNTSQHSTINTDDNAPYMTIGELSKRIKDTVEGAFDYVRVRAEISRPTRAPSGHVYFTLKDDRSTLAAVCWKTVAGNLQIQPEEGLEVICSGRLTTYAGQSKYQIIVSQMEIAGEGAMLKMLEERRRMLAAEGLFDAERKRPIPEMPTTIGVITSPTGAVIRDILHRLTARFGVHVLVWGSLVQGKNAASQVAAAIRGFDAIKAGGAIARPDLLIVARGGGALEDLWAFNEEEVVRAVADCSLPVISAIGHETDTTLIDFAADLRAPTPTAAAELAVPVHADLAARISEADARLKRGISRRLEHADQLVRMAVRGLLDPAEMMARRGQMLDYALAALNASLERRLAARRLDLSGLAGRLRPPEIRLAEMSGHFTRLSDRFASAFALMLDRHEQVLNSAGKLLDANSFERVLDRGFALVTDMRGTPLKRAVDAPQGAKVTLHFTDARRQATLDPDDIKPKPARIAKKAAKSPASKASKQDNLF